MTAMRAIKRRAAKRPTPRTVHVVIEEGDFAGWEATVRADFPARLLADFDSGNIARVMAALDAIIVDHNFPNSEDEVAANITDVDPYDGLQAISDKIGEALTKLPNR